MRSKHILIFQNCISKRCFKLVFQNMISKCSIKTFFNNRKHDIKSLFQISISKVYLRTGFQSAVSNSCFKIILQSIVSKHFFRVKMYFLYLQNIGSTETWRINKGKLCYWRPSICISMTMLISS